MHWRLGRVTLCALLAISLLLAFNGGSIAAKEEFPVKPIYMLVGYPPGGSTDSTARGLAMVAPEYLNNQPVVVVNKAGAAGQLAPKFVATSEPDGYTLLMGWGGVPYVFRKEELPYDPFKDFKPVISVAVHSVALAVPADSPFKNLDDLVKHAREDPGELTWAHTGRGSEHHLDGVDFIVRTGIDVVEIPYLGGVQTRNAVAGGHVDFGLLATFLTPEMVADGKIRVLGICTEERSPLFPDYPTFKEQGYDSVNIQGVKMVAVPADTPDWKIQILHDAFKKCMEHPAFQKYMKLTRLVPNYLDPKESLEFVREMDKRFTELIEQIGIESFI